MSWWEWISACVFVAVASAAAVMTYFHWAFRWKIRWLGTSCEIALAILILTGGVWAIAALARHIP